MATDDKYDRQLRLWGSQGQRNLARTRVLSVGTSSAGTETLKNLVLPGIGAFTIMDFVDRTDGANVSDSSSVVSSNFGKFSETDASTNFFLPISESINLTQGPDPSHRFRSKAEVACKYLQELNPDVSGSYRDLSLVLGNNKNPNTSSYWEMTFHQEKSRQTNSNDRIDKAGEEDITSMFVVAADVSPPSFLDALADTCYEHGYPLVVVTSYGLIGTVRLQLPQDGAILLQPKPANEIADLRLVTSFPSFRQFVDSIDLDKLDNQQHGHVPYPVLLVKAMDRFLSDKASVVDSNRKECQGKNNLMPKNFMEKQEFASKYVKDMARDYDKQLNFQEAVANAYLAYTERDLNLDFSVEVPMMDDTTPKNKIMKLGLLRAALEAFIEEHPDRRPPLKGAVPDMTASTEMYIRLQKIYLDQAEEDVQKMIDISRRQNDGRGKAILTEEDIRNFCSNIYTVGHLQTRSLREEYYGCNSDDNLVEEWKMALMDPYEVAVHTPFLWYLGLRAAQIFCDQEGRYPGCDCVCSNGENTTILKEDANKLVYILKEKVIPHYKLADQELLSSENEENGNLLRICEELTRYGNAEIHTVASVVGGVASQECVKIITEQYIPLNNTYVYNGIVSCAGVYRF